MPAAVAPRPGIREEKIRISLELSTLNAYLRYNFIGRKAI